MHRALAWLLVWAAAGAIASGPIGCAGRQVRGDLLGAVEAPVEGAATEGILGPLDVVFIRVFDEPEISGEYRVDGDGTISFPFLGPLITTGLTPRQLSEQLAEGLRDGYLLDPVVTVFLKESHSRKILVMGSVKRPGTYPYRDGMSVVEAIALAGGVAEDGALNRTRITRQTPEGEVYEVVQVGRIATGDEPNVILKPDDIVFVPKSVI